MIDDKPIAQITESCPNLKSINLDYLKQITIYPISLLTEKCNQLISISLLGVNIDVLSLNNIIGSITLLFF